MSLFEGLERARGGGHRGEGWRGGGAGYALAAAGSGCAVRIE